MYDAVLIVTGRRPVLITSGRHPFELGPLVACALAGGGMAIFGLRPPSMTEALPESVLTGWLALVSAGGLIGLVGCYWRGGIDDALLIEFAGVVAVGAACTLYVVALFTVNTPTTAIAAGGLLAGIAGGAWGRAVQCVRDWLAVRGARVEHGGDLPLLTEQADDGPAGSP